MDKKTPSFIFSVRFLVALLGFFCTAIQYSQRINISVAIVCMINHTALHERDATKSYDLALVTETGDDYDTNACQKNDKNKTIVDGPFLWGSHFICMFVLILVCLFSYKSIQGHILSSFFYGYLLTQIPGGFASFIFGSRLVLGISILLSSIFTILVPVSARVSYLALMICRFTVGAAHGLVWPAMTSLWANWAPPAERSRLSGIASAGSQIGNVIALSLGGFLCTFGIDGGWPSIFYVFGGIGVIWSIAWIALTNDTPTKHCFISDKEKEYIVEATRETVSNSNEKKNIPLKQIMTSSVCVSIFIVHTTNMFGTYLFLTQLPTYMQEVLKFDIHSNGLLSSLPYIGFFAFIVISGYLSDSLIKKKKLTRTQARKLFNVLGSLVPMFAVLGLTMVTCKNQYIGVALLTLGLTFTGCAYGSGFLVNFNDVAGSFSGIGFGISNTFGSIPGFIAPILVSFFTKNKTQKEWSIVFYITAAVYLIGAIVAIIWTSGELQPWAIIKKKSITKKEQDEEETFINSGK